MKECGPKRLTSGKKDNAKSVKKMATINRLNDGNKNLKKEDGSMTTPTTEWWKDLQSTKPGPSRIRVTLNRDLTPAEQEHLRTMGEEIYAAYGDKFRLSRDGRIYVESRAVTSRQLFNDVSFVLAYSFVNVFPTAVRTFRELIRVAATVRRQKPLVQDAVDTEPVSIEDAKKPSKAELDIVSATPPVVRKFVNERNGWDEIFTNPIANQKRTKAKEATVV